MRYARLHHRLLAFFIDVLVLGGLVLLTILSIPPLIGLWPLEVQSGWLLEPYVLFTVSLPSWLYFALCESSPAQATIGKLILGLYVTDDDGARLSFPRAMARTLFKFLPWELFHLSLLIPHPVFAPGADQFRLGFVFVYAMLVLYVGFCWWSPERQSVHDLMTDSCVLRRPTRAEVEEEERRELAALVEEFQGKP
ncbi:MAG TPA: RDD family protein [Fimbriimonadaceae bacterium]|nr:RDD family protein [Fimbriimonadaceae bacterium]